MRRRLLTLATYASILKGIKRQIREVQGPEPEDLKRYYRDYARELERASPERAGADDFLRAAKGAEVVLVGDFHTLDQAQKQFLRVLQSLTSAGARPCVGLEMVRASADAGLQRYLRGEVDEDHLLGQIDYFQHWEFDFAHYRPILEYLRETRIPARGINREGSLKGRDAFMAGRVSELRSQHGGGPALVLVGDLHLASKHLPSALRKRGLEPTVLFQNSETVQMRTMRRGGVPPGLLARGEAWWSLGGGRFLVNNTVPWVKMMTYLTWLEHGGEALCAMYGYCKYREDEGAEVDLTETLHGYVRVLKSLFDLRMREDDGFQVFTLTDLEFLHDPYFRTEPGRAYARIIRGGRPLFMTWRNTIYIPLLDVNRTAQEAAHYLMGRDLSVARNRTGFHDRIHYFASGYVASKLINPVRREDTEEDFREVLRKLPTVRRPRERAYLAQQALTAEAALDYLDALRSGRPFGPALVERLLGVDHAGDFALSEALGRTVGGGLFHRYDAGELSGLDLRKYIFEQHNPHLFHRAEP